MTFEYYQLRFYAKMRLLLFVLRNIVKERFSCPICGYCGPFADIDVPTGYRKHARCPKCDTCERTRTQYLVLKDIFSDLNISDLSILHFAPEPFFREFFSKRFGRYETADLDARNVDHNVDLQDLPFEDESYDFVFASHVLEHVPDDDKAISEIRRILRPDGIAVLPVPIVAEETIEYSEPIPAEAYHMRSPGFDYFDKYERHFSRVDRIYSSTLPHKYQVFVYEDRTHWPTEACPLRHAMQGEKHVDIVPVCYV